MNKSLKIALSTLALVPCAALFVGCGQDQLATKANVNTEGTYAASSKEAFTTYAGEGGTASTTLSGYRFTMDAKVSGSVVGQSYNSSALLNGIVKTSEKSVEAAFKMTMEGQDIMKAYIKDGYVYANISSKGQSLKIKYEADIDDVFGEFGEMGMAGPTTISDVQEILNFINNNKDLDIEASVEGEINKFHFSADSTDISAMLGSATEIPGGATEIPGSDFDCYFVFNSDILTGAQVSFKYQMTSGDFGNAGIDAKITIEKFDGEISFPSFDEYTETDFNL